MGWEPLITSISCLSYLAEMKQMHTSKDKCACEIQIVVTTESAPTELPVFHPAG